MKDIEHIEEMLNSYLDGELDERKANEVKRLLDNDTEARDIYDSLKRYKSLMETAEQAPVPEGLSESITKQLERQILLADTGVYSHHAGRRHLILRRLTTVAAVVVLGAVLTMVVFDIFVPKSSRDKLLSGIKRKQNIKQVLYEKPFEDTAPPEDKKVVAKQVRNVPLVATLSLETDHSIEADWLIAKILSTTGLFSKTEAVERQSGLVRYVLNCSNQSLTNLMAELQFIWPQCSNVKFGLGTEQLGSYITIDKITVEQVMEICRTNDFGQRLRMANDMAIINKIALTDGLEKFYAIKTVDYETILSQKPALTSSQTAQNTANGPDTVTLTINLVSK